MIKFDIDHYDHPYELELGGRKQKRYWMWSIASPEVVSALAN